MNVVEEEVKTLVGKELASANERFPAFRSAHEGWAVLHEEVCECAESKKCLIYLDNELWESVMHDRGCQRRNVEMLLEEGVHLACEAIQVAAMARKYLDLFESEDE